MVCFWDGGGGDSHLIVTCNGRIVVAGDHIYSWRTFSPIYAHHGIYVGNNLVVHFSNPDRNSSSISISSSSSSSSNTNSRRTCSQPGCEITKDNNGVIISCMDCFLENGSLYRYEYGVSWFEYRFNRKGTCTSAKSDPADVVVNRAMCFLHHGYYGDYNVILNNCEDFAVYCKTGKKFVSGQVQSFMLL